MAAKHRLEISLDRTFGDFQLRIDHCFPFDGISALFGPSGSGKSTLLRAIAGLDDGPAEISFNAKPWANKNGRALAPHRRNVGLVFQDARLFDHLDVAGNLRFPMKRANATARDWETVVGSLDLEPLLQKATGSLSGGEQQRVALGRALLSKPELLLLDEPLAALDGRRKLDILPYLQRLAIDFDVPTLFVSHSIEEVSQLASHVTLLDSGRVVAAGPTTQMLERPDLQSLTGRFEAGSTLNAVVVRHDFSFKLTHMDVSGQEIVMPMIKSLDVGETVPLRLRARDVALSVAPVTGVSIRNQIKGKIAEIFPENDTAFAEVLVDVNGSRIRSRVTRFALADLQLIEGSDVVVLIKSVAFDRRGLKPAR